MLYFLYLLALISHELGLKIKEINNQPSLNNFNLNVILNKMWLTPQLDVLVTAISPAVLCYATGQN